MTNNVISKEGLAQLKAGIIGSAVTDYVWGYIKKNRYLRVHTGKLTIDQKFYVKSLERDIDSAERFFKSEWFEELASDFFDRHWILEKMDKIRNSESKRAYDSLLRMVTAKIANSYKS